VQVVGVGVRLLLDFAEGAEEFGDGSDGFELDAGAVAFFDVGHGEGVGAVVSFPEESSSEFGGVGGRECVGGADESGEARGAGLFADREDEAGAWSWYGEDGAAVVVPGFDESVEEEVGGVGAFGVVDDGEEVGVAFHFVDVVGAEASIESIECGGEGVFPCPAPVVEVFGAEEVGVFAGAECEDVEGVVEGLAADGGAGGFGESVGGGEGRPEEGDDVFDAAGDVVGGGAVESDGERGGECGVVGFDGGEGVVADDGADLGAERAGVHLDFAAVEFAGEGAGGEPFVELHAEEAGGAGVGVGVGGVVGGIGAFVGVVVQPSGLSWSSWAGAWGSGEWVSGAWVLGAWVSGRSLRPPKRRSRAAYSRMALSKPSASKSGQRVGVTKSSA